MNRKNRIMGLLSHFTLMGYDVEGTDKYVFVCFWNIVKIIIDILLFRRQKSKKLKTKNIANCMIIKLTIKRMDNISFHNLS